MTSGSGGGSQPGAAPGFLRPIEQRFRFLLAILKARGATNISIVEDADEEGLLLAECLEPVQPIDHIKINFVVGETK